MLLALTINFDHQRENLKHDLLAVDGDGYWHLLRVRNMHRGDWNNEINERGNAPFGERIHWSSAFDLVLLAGARFGTLFTDFETSLRWTGVVIGPVLFVMTALMLLAFGRVLLSPTTAVFPAILFVIDPFQSQSVFCFCRPDHHCFVMFSFILYYCVFTLLTSRTDLALRASLVGAIGAFAIWVGLELFVLVGLSVVYAGMLWLINGEKYAGMNLRLTAGLWIGLLVTLLLDEKAANYLMVSYDKRSIVHITLFALIALYWLAIVLLNKAGVGRGIRSRALLAVVCGSMLTTVFLNIFPRFLTGPLTSVHEGMSALYLNKTSEFGTNVIEIVRHLLLAVPSFCYLVYIMIRTSDEKRRQCAWMLFALCAYALLGLKMHRWLNSLQILCIFPNAMILISMLSWENSIRNTAAAFGFCLLLLLGPHLVLFSYGQEERKVEELRENYMYQVLDVLTFMEASDETDAREIVLANMNLGPLIMYRTSFDVVGTPNHNNESGILDTYRILNAVDPGTARTLIRERNIDYLLLDSQVISFGRIPLEGFDADNRTTFLDRLVDGPPVDWLVEVDLPESLSSEFRLFRVPNP